MYIDDSVIDNRSPEESDILLSITTKDFLNREELLNNVREIVLKKVSLQKLKNRRQIVML